MLAAAIAGQSLGACAKTTEDPDMHPVGGEAVAGAAAGPGSGSAGFAGATLAGRGGAGTAGDPWPFGMTVPPYGISPLPPDAGKPDPSDAGKPKPSEEDAGDEDAGTE
jgi:hypothetical protein